MGVFGGLKAKTADTSKNVGLVKFHLSNFCRIESYGEKSFMIVHNFYFPQKHPWLINPDLGLALANFIWLTD